MALKNIPLNAKIHLADNYASVQNKFSVFQVMMASSVRSREVNINININTNINFSFNFNSRSWYSQAQSTDRAQSDTCS